MKSFVREVSLLLLFATLGFLMLMIEKYFPNIMLNLVLCAAGEPLKDSSGERNMECSPTGSGANTCPSTHSCESTSGSTTFGGVCCPRPQYVCKLSREQVENSN